MGESAGSWIHPASVAAELLRNDRKCRSPKKCYSFDSRDYTDVSDSDVRKTHYLNRAGKNWGTAIGGRILKFTREAGATSSVLGGNKPGKINLDSRNSSEAI